jgi:hypothetical protein
MPYALLTPREHPGTLLVGFHTGEMALTRDAGESWEMLDVRLPGIVALGG